MSSTIELKLDGLEPLAQLCWIVLVDQFRVHLAANAAVLVDLTALDDRIASAIGKDRSLNDVDLLPEQCDLSAGREFVFASSLSILHDGFVQRFSTVVIAPSGYPDKLDQQIFWLLCATGRYAQRLQACVDQVFGTGELARVKKHLATLKPATFRAALISSVFDGDRFLDVFLANIVELNDYGHCQHLLFRPGSPGQEHDVLLEHIRSHSNAVYINLRKDPGLYNTWNIGCALARAPLVSNANVDDRRAPEQVSRLVDLLEGHENVVIASAALRVTETLNQDWSLPGEVDVWFGEGIPEEYGGEFLINRTAEGDRPRCVPHCMPVWRRCLHGWYGGFRESLYGPCADWELWLRAGAAGCRLGHVPEPLGLYVRRPGSHWRANPDAERFNKRVIDHYAPALFGAERASSDIQVPDSLWLEDVRRAISCGDWLNAALLLIVQGGQHLQAGGDHALAETVSAFGRRYFGLDDLSGWLLDEAHRPRPGLPSLADALTWMVDWLHLCTRNGQSSPAAGVLSRYQALFSDLHGQTGDAAALFACALVERCREDRQAEFALLRAARDRDPLQFWSRFQVAYRFTVPLGEVVHEIEPRLKRNLWPTERARMLFFFPDYTEKNPYQRLLYQGELRRGTKVCGVQEPEELEALSPEPNTVIHLHWIHPLLTAETQAQATHRARAFLQRVAAWQQSGVRVFWTIHNRLSHEARFPDTEWHFRKALSRRVDRVLVHHPMVLELVDWLDDNARLAMVEHGAYHSVGAHRPDRAEARADLELMPDDLVLCHVGAVKPYKALEARIRVLEPLMRRHRQLKLIVAGNVWSKSARAALDELPDGQLRLFDEFANEARLELCYHAADFALLSYRDILTSGSLFRAYSSGCPVMAPALGTIPAYVVPGWNGFLYGSDEELESVLLARLDEPDARHAFMRENAQQTAASLSWD